ncbi:hypothetical protein HRG_002481 [Hirsutella rhossiliensis]|uniref:Uncharacterized protein n=1 Tax=Hirsutella rhossiliensis TaxID=111463 RepID=A0A9P8N5P8_9HYPO|nr:uncharacterized protein HRG_02481 [Hirsutella rhossiliensis]KAH0967072.1 hypothetical protein HRG_02481 [Hirsutella rhossiliensis]
MADAQRTVVSQQVRRGREYLEYSDGSLWTRKADDTTGQWTPVEAPVAQEPEPPTRYLSVMVEHQAEGEPKHWYLLSHQTDPAGAGKGQVWQVTGDAECMYYRHTPDVDGFNSDSFAWHQVLNSNLSHSQFATVDRIARAEPAPLAVNRAAVTENCQGWVMRVLRRLMDVGIVKESSVTILQGYMDPV